MKLINNSLTRKLLALLLCVYFILGAGLLVVRYWVPQNIDNWRAQIESRLSKSFGLGLSMGAIELNWYGWQPTISIENTQLKDQQQNTLLQIPYISMDLDWQAFFDPDNGPVNLHVKGMDLSITRLDRTNLLILDQKLDLLGDNFDIGWLTTLLNQPYISFSDATIRWDDQYRLAPELKLTDINAVLAHDKRGDLGLSLGAHVPQASLSNLHLKAHLNKNNLAASLENLTDIDAWLAVDNFKFTDWTNWIDIPPGLKNNNTNLQLWLDTKSADRKFTMLLSTSDLSFTEIEGLSASAGQFDLLLQNSLGNIDAFALFGDGDKQDLFSNIKFDLRADRLSFDDKSIFRYQLAADAIESAGDIDYVDQFKIKIKDLYFKNQDIQFNSYGSWRLGPGAGLSDFNGKIKYANLAAIYKYLPNDVDIDAHDWLKDGLIAGDLANGDFYLRGDLDEFPFGLKSAAGDFLVAGDFSNAHIDFVPDADEQDKWPHLYIDNGYASLHRASLYLKSDQALMLPIDDHEITLSKLQAVIPDIEYDSVLSVKGNSHASGQTYMELIKNTPLSEMLNGIFDEAEASGQWQVPLSLVVPLSNSIDTQVNGSIDFNDAELQFFPVAPRFSKISGNLSFTEEGIDLAQALDATLLGGPVKLSGKLGGKDAGGLLADGTITANALADYVGTHGMRRVQGSLNYQAVLKQQGDAYVLSMDSNTKNLSLDLPAPLSKPADEAMSLNIVWTDADKNDESLKINFGNVLKLDLLHKSGTSTGPYFHSAALGIERAAKIHGQGLVADIEYPLIDLDVWDGIIKEFEQPINANQSSGRVLWPSLRLLTIQADQLRALGTRVDRAVMRAEKKDNKNWSLTINSDQTSGNVKWQEQNGKLSGTVKASFDQLSLGDDPEDTNSLLPVSVVPDRIINDELNIPAMVIEANNLRIYGRSFGKLNIEGTRYAKEKYWQLDRLRLGNQETAILKGTGVWHLSGPNRGLQINADVEMQDLGQWMDNAGWQDVLTGGAGQLKGKFDWKDLPWKTNISDLSGELNAGLTNGRFIKVNSSSAKILELLSLQSITRLNKIERGFLDLTESGFPFDQLHGEMKLKNGDIEIDNYKITGPVATILIEGVANIGRRDMDLDAVVVPNIDVSGAAVAAGIAINPLVGLGAFVTQWLLKGPLAKSMTVRYQVTGSWDDPKTTEIPVKQK